MAKIIQLFGVIGADWWSDDPFKNTAESFRKKLPQDLSEDIILEIDTMGGSVVEGSSMIAEIQRRTGNTTAIVVGHAYSMGMPIVAACQQRYAVPNASFMIHGAATGAWGTKEKLSNTIDYLEEFEDRASEVLEKATNLSKEQIKDQFFNGLDHVFTTKKAVEMGLIHQVVETTPEQKEALLNFYQKQDGIVAKFSLPKKESLLENLKNRLAKLENKINPKTETMKLNQETHPNLIKALGEEELTEKNLGTLEQALNKNAKEVKTEEPKEELQQLKNQLEESRKKEQENSELLNQLDGRLEKLENSHQNPTEPQTPKKELTNEQIQQKLKNI